MTAIDNKTRLSEQKQKRKRKGESLGFSQKNKKTQKSRQQKTKKGAKVRLLVKFSTGINNFRTRNMSDHHAQRERREQSVGVRALTYFCFF